MKFWLQAGSFPSYELTLISTFELSWLRVLLLGPSHCDSLAESMSESFVKPAWKHKTSTWSCLQNHQKLEVSSLNAKGFGGCWFGRQLVHWALNPLVPVPEPPQRINFLQLSFCMAISRLRTLRSVFPPAPNCRATEHPKRQETELAELPFNFTKTNLRTRLHLIDSHCSDGLPLRIHWCPRSQSGMKPSRSGINMFMTCKWVFL